ncbi:unnamed protein product [Cyclocybe aegerita]|uniref:FAD-binding domain-containing protein n=1 Tax=Cyclocybe aegerita TaxID=1973307 RepID=A0A8S0W4I3_CYCAE|nr:unnamed protein product [Cyclocybe aegerita]
MLWPRVWEVFKSLGLEDDLVKRLHEGGWPPKGGTVALASEKSDMREGVPFFNLIPEDAHDVLLKHITPATRFHLSSRLVSYKDAGMHIELLFKDGRTATCDLLVGADGINSGVRKTLLSGSKPESEVIKKINLDHPALKGGMVYYGRDRASYTYWDAAQWTSGGREVAQCLVKNMDRPSKWAIQAVTPLDNYVEGRIALLGDAALGMRPHLGNGAGQAFEDLPFDASILSNTIAKSVQPGKVDIPKILETYKAIRQPFGSFVARETRNTGLLYELTDAVGFEGIREGDTVSSERLAKLGKEINEEWAWSCIR